MGTVKGFILTRQWVESAEGQTLIYWVATTDGPVKVIVENQESVFFLPENLVSRAENILNGVVDWRHQTVKLCDFNHNSVHACYFKSQRDLNIARSRLSAKQISGLEADVRPTDRYLMERFINGAVSITGEVAPTFHSTLDSKLNSNYRAYLNPHLEPATLTPVLKVASLDIETSYTENVLYSIAVAGEGFQKVFMIGQQTEGEADYLEFLIDETHLIIRFLSWFEELDPDVIVGWSVVAFDLNFLEQRCQALQIEFTLGRGGEAVRWRTSQQRQNRHYALVPGRVVIDGIEMLRTATWTFESFALDFVARELLGRGKLVDNVESRASEIQEMFRDDKLKLAAYNLEDCQLVLEIFAVTHLLEFCLERGRLTGLELDRAGGSVAAFDFLYLPRLHRQGFVAPVADLEQSVSSPGGYVLDSTPGLFEDVVLLDFKSLYPSIIRTFHVDPLAMITADKEEDSIPGFKGSYFSRTHYILPTIIEGLWEARDQAKKLNQAAMSQAIKIIMNSFYGVLGTTGCRFFDPRLASSITLRGHEILQQTRDLLEERGHRVIYGDTDSVFVHLKGVEDVDATAEELVAYLNKWWREYLQQSFGLVSQLELEYESRFVKFLMPTIRGSDAGSKKRYAGVVMKHGQKELVFKGLETVRSDWSQVAREFQQNLYKMIFYDEPFEQYVKETVAAVYRGEKDNQLVLRKRLRRNLADYVKNIPPHVRAARIAEQEKKDRGTAGIFSASRWIEYVMTVSGPEPKQFLSADIDYDFYIEKQLAPVADAILAFKGTSLGQITDKQMGLF